MLFQNAAAAVLWPLTLLCSFSDFSYHSVSAAGEGGGARPRPPPPPPGMSEKALKRVLGDSPLSPENLEKAKLGILNFLSSEVLSEGAVVCHYVIASSDTRHRSVKCCFSFCSCVCVWGGGVGVEEGGACVCGGLCMCVCIWFTLFLFYVLLCLSSFNNISASLFISSLSNFDLHFLLLSLLFTFHSSLLHPSEESAVRTGDGFCVNICLTTSCQFFKTIIATFGHSCVHLTHSYVWKLNPCWCVHYV